MKIFMIKPTVKNGNFVYRDVIPTGNVDWTDVWKFDGTLKGSSWEREARRVKLLGGKKKRMADFLPCTPGSAFAMVDLIDGDVARILRQCGELLPVTVLNHDAPISIVNVAPITDALDLKKSEGRLLGDASPERWIDHYAFDASLVPERSVFKVRGDSWKIFASQGVVAKYDDFKALVEERGYTGLEFCEVWSADGEAV